MIGWLRGMISGTQPEPLEWTVATGEEEGRPLVIRTRTGAPAGMAIECYPHSVEVMWPLEAGSDGDMPSSELMASMGECEDLLASLEGPANGLLGMTITGNRRREWVWYVADVADFSAKVRELVGKSGRQFPVEVRPGGGAS